MELTQGEPVVIPVKIETCLRRSITQADIVEGKFAKVLTVEDYKALYEVNPLY